MSDDVTLMADLLRLRLVVARFGEMDVAKWWNTNGQLGRFGAAALRRGFPRTHYFAQARSTFAVARQRCMEIFEPPDSVTLWHLTEKIEDEFDAYWEHLLDHANDWEPFFEQLQSVSGGDLVATLRSFQLVTEGDLESYAGYRRSAEGRAVQIPGVFSSSWEHIIALGLGFARGEVGAPAVPYQLRGNA